jgi:hypothetical protein
MELITRNDNDMKAGQLYLDSENASIHSLSQIVAIVPESDFNTGMDHNNRQIPISTKRVSNLATIFEE